MERFTFLFWSLCLMVSNDCFSVKSHADEDGGAAVSRFLKKRPIETEDQDPKPQKKSRPPKTTAVKIFQKDAISLKGAKGTTKRGGGKGGYHWSVWADNKKAGKVFINLTESEALGQHASLQIFLNKASQGKHIGRHAYQLACEASPYDTIYVHIAKGNAASIKAATAAGFQEVKNVSKQMLMRWVRAKKKA